MLEPRVMSMRHCAASWGCLLAMYRSSTALITLSLIAACHDTTLQVRKHPKYPCRAQHESRMPVILIW